MMGVFQNIDCMEGMTRYSDNHFDLAIVDPPYGVGAVGVKDGKTNRAIRKSYHLFKNFSPNRAYFDNLFRISLNQIVWGGNYFGLAGGYIVWRKKSGFENNTIFGDSELAYCSLQDSVKTFEWNWNGMWQQNMKQKEVRIHPTQKPVALYRWLLKNYAKPGDLILDTHVGSASSLIACELEGFDYVGFEIDKDYYEAANKRMKQVLSQLRLAV